MSNPLWFFVYASTTAVFYFYTNTREQENKKIVFESVFVFLIFQRLSP